MTATHPKSTCCIMGCTRWSRRYPHEWMCGTHWRLVRRREKSLFRRIWKRKAALYATYAGDKASWTREQQMDWERLDRLETRVWDREKERITLHCAGI